MPLWLTFCRRGIASEGLDGHGLGPEHEPEPELESEPDPELGAPSPASPGLEGAISIELRFGSLSTTIS
jgi:hypothetical protein